MPDTAWKRREVVIPGVPVAKGRPRAAVVGGHARVYTPKATRQWEAMVRDLAAQAIPCPAPSGVPVELDCCFWFALPKGQHRKREPRTATPHTKRPDADNLVKAIKDGLNGVAWLDDSQVSSLRVVKMVCGQADNRPRTEIVLRRLTASCGEKG